MSKAVAEICLVTVAELVIDTAGDEVFMGAITEQSAIAFKLAKKELIGGPLKRR